MTTAIGLLTVPLLDPILSALGAHDEAKQFAIDYLRIVSPSLPLLGDSGTARRLCCGRSGTRDER